MIRSIAVLSWCAGLLASGTLSAAALSVPAGFSVVTVAHLNGPRELASLPDGDLLIGTSGSSVYILPAAERTLPGTVTLFATVPDDEAAGVAYSSQRREIYIGTEHGVYETRYVPGARHAGSVALIARVRTGPIAPHSDGDVHVTTSVVADRGALYASVGSSCNACVEVDPTRAAIFRVGPDGRLIKKAARIRNAIALAVDPQTGALWAGGAGQDDLPFGHPYEFLDDVTSHAGIADYGWPFCEENRHAYTAGANCRDTVEPLVELPAYSTIIGATFYPRNQTGPFAFPAFYRGGLFAAAHGSWHTTSDGGYAAKPQVAFVRMNGDEPLHPVDWSSPTTQWRTFLGGFQPKPHERVGRPTGIVVGTLGSLFVADDDADAIYRVRPRR